MPQTQSIRRSHGGLELAFQQYQRLTRNGGTRRAWLTARENRRSARPILRQGIQHSPRCEYILSQLAATDGWLSVNDMIDAAHDLIAVSNVCWYLWTLLHKYAHVEPLWIKREMRPIGPHMPGIEYWYRLTPRGREIMACVRDDA
jgi:hypothetical protein